MALHCLRLHCYVEDSDVCYEMASLVDTLRQYRIQKKYLYEEFLTQLP